MNNWKEQRKKKRSNKLSNAESQKKKRILLFPSEFYKEIQKKIVTKTAKQQTNQEMLK